MSNVESPNHYTAGYIEVIYSIHDVLGAEGFKAFCIGNYIKYNARANHKGMRAEDLAKADQYLEWATNGLPAPVNGRVPRKPDLYKQFAEAMAGPQAGEAVKPEIKAPTDETVSPNKPADVHTCPTAKTVSNAIGPCMQRRLGVEAMRKIRLRVTRDKYTCGSCENEHFGFTAYIYDRTDDGEISRAVMLTDDPQEDLCEMVAEVLAADAKDYMN
jgi:hypothetical protein